MYEHLQHELPPDRFRTPPGVRGEGRFARGFRLARLSWNVIEGDRSLLALPVLMLFAYFGVLLTVFGPFALAAEGDSSVRPLVYGAIVVAYPLNVVSTFFGVAFVAVVRKRFAGEVASLRDGLGFARGRIGPILGWALVSTLVGLVIRALERVRGGVLAARIAGWILGAAWALATLFVVPVLASTDPAPLRPRASRLSSCGSAGAKRWRAAR